jgi:hypothetical protein
VDQGKNGVKSDGGPEPRRPAEDPERKAEELDEKAEAIRENLTDLVNELDHRRHQLVRRYVKPIGIGLGIVGFGVVAVLAWRRWGRTPSKAVGLVGALGRIAAHRERVAPQTSISKRVLGAAAAAAVSVAARQLATQVLATLSSEKAGVR